MLTHITIKNLTIIEQLELDLAPGLSVVTGETGAGKSIWVDAVQLALGARAESHLVRPEATRGEITLCFDVTQITQAQQWLQEQAFADDTQECIIRRIIERNNRSRCTINGSPVTLNMLQEFAQLVLTVHSQHQQQHLLKEEGQQSQIDQFAQLTPLLQDTQTLFQQWQQLQQQSNFLKTKLRHRDAELELLTYQLAELAEFAPQADEWQELSTVHRQLAHSEQSQTTLKQALRHLHDDEQGRSANTQLQQAQPLLKSLLATFPAMNSCHELLNQADIYLQEAIAELADFQSQLEVNPQKLHAIEQRLSKMHDLARKHQVEPDDLLSLHQQLTTKIADLTAADEKILALERQQLTLLTDYQHLAAQLSAKRSAAAQFISQQVTQSMQELGMQGGHFKVELLPRETTIHPAGQEKIQFFVCTNPGQTLQPLAKIVSGGELSRIHLALQVIIAQQAQTPTLVFDEVDVGIGGQTAAIVGQLLQQLSQNTQVICITHLPQVAAYGQQHYKVSKLSRQQQTFSDISCLDYAARIEELARMLSGAQITSQTRAHAAELLEPSP